MADQKSLIGEFVTVEGFGDTPFYVASELGHNRYEMVNSKNKISYGIDTAAQKVEIWKKTK